jgi:hypothetical protein
MSEIWSIHWHGISVFYLIATEAPFSPVWSWCILVQFLYSCACFFTVHFIIILSHSVFSQNTLHKFTPQDFCTHFHVIFTMHFDSISSIITNKCTFCISVTLLPYICFGCGPAIIRGTLVGSLHWHWFIWYYHTSSQKPKTLWWCVIISNEPVPVKWTY